jgi:predicted nucleic acid-binding protein
MGVTEWLVDMSAIARLHQSPDGSTWDDRVERGLVHLATVTRLEVGYAARSGGDLKAALATAPLGRMPVAYLTPAMEDRAVDVQLMLADRGHHRGPSVADLLVAATAELSGLTILHVDKDFDLIADVTGQPVERLAM